ncbi:hypothetical protein KEM48_009568 [Puccinia striiformis f. sp. tritici PST-130]|nr:hypothetical protein KEM48_009568 [Puccinia striiformis f. sp. tritici PST-130]
MWIGLCTIPILLLATGVRSYDPTLMDQCFAKSTYQECVNKNASVHTRALTCNMLSPSAPKCSAIPQKLFKECCPPSGILNPHRWPTAKTGSGCPKPNQPEKPHGGCGSVSPAYYKRCLEQHEPQCKDIPRKDYERCCKGEPGHKEKKC